jgi:hypothetical protein
MMNSTVYQPTPIEEAHSLYLLQQAFGLFPPYNILKISGRLAVPFLTTSGVDRFILRSIWSAADPQNSGSLTQLSQFHLVLRLVAMSQAGMLNPSMTSDNIIFAVQQYAPQKLSLPTFSNVNLPEPEQLMSTYGNNSTTSNVNHQPIENAFDTLASVQAAPLPVLQQQTGYGEQFGGSIGAPLQQDQFSMQQPNQPFSMQQSVGALPDANDPFGALGGVEDVPLPSLDNVALHQTAVSGSEPMQSDPTDPFTAVSSGTMEIGAPHLGGFADGTGIAVVETAGDDDEDFGGFEGVEASSGIEATNGESVLDVDMSGTEAMAPDPFDAFGGIEVQDAPLPSLEQYASGPGTGIAVAENDNDDDDEEDFGGFEEAETSGNNVAIGESAPQLGASFPPAMQSGSSDPFAAVSSDKIEGGESQLGGSILDAFGGLEVQDAPLPSLDQFASGTGVAVAQNADDDDEDFGGFEEAETSGNDVASGGSPELMPFPQDMQSDPSDPLAAVSDAFGGLEVQDAPLPSLDQFASGTGTPAVENVDDDDEDFGGFEGVETSGSEATSREASLQVGMSGTEAMHSDPSNPFAATYSGTLEGGSPQLGGPISDVFGGLEVQDAPLPSLDQFSSGAGTQAIETADGDDDEDFGGFEGAATSGNDAPTETYGSEAMQSNENMDYDIFGGFQKTDSMPLSDTGATMGTGSDQSVGRQFSGADDASFYSAQTVTSGELDPNAFRGAIQDEQQCEFGSGIEPPMPAAAPLGQPGVSDVSDDPFSAFDPIPTLQVHESTPPGLMSLTEATASEAIESDDFGAFDGPSTSETQKRSTGDDEFGAFDGATPAQPQEQGAVTDQWSGFESAAEAQEQHVGYDEFKADDDDDDDDFGDFGSFDQAPAISAVDASEPQEQQAAGNGECKAQTAAAGQGTNDDDDFDESFGDFGSFEEAPASTSFSPAEPAKLELVQPQEIGAEFEASFGDFAAVSSPPEGSKDFEDGSLQDAVRLRDQIRSMSLQLPDPLRRKVGSSDDIDLGECFEVNIGMDIPLDASRRQRAERCIQLLELLSTSQTKRLGSTYWRQVFTVALEELAFGITLLNEAERLSSREREQVRRPLELLIAGFAEYIRVVRSIVATIGDLLMLEPSALLTIDTWTSTWCSMSIIENVLVIEKLWKEIRNKSSELGLSMSSAVESKDNSLNAIRTTSVHRFPASSHVCQLTLQPISPEDKETTKSEVTWQGRKYMACSANFLVHRCPFYVVGE